MSAKIKDLTGMRFGKLQVIALDHTSDRAYWICKCDCGNTKIVPGNELQKMHVKSCGCLMNSQNRRKHNVFDLNGSYGIGWTVNTNKEFYFDLEDYEKISGYTWREFCVGDYGYIVSGILRTGKMLRMHRLILNADKNLVVDHINHNVRDNRKSNLRAVSQENNCMNKKVQSNNKSGTAGVYYDIKCNRWISQLKLNGIYAHRKRYKTKEEAVKARKEAEEKYFGEFSYKE